MHSTDAPRLQVLRLKIRARGIVQQALQIGKIRRAAHLRAYLRLPKMQPILRVHTIIIIGIKNKLKSTGDPLPVQREKPCRTFCSARLSF